MSRDITPHRLRRLGSVVVTLLVTGFVVANRREAPAIGRAIRAADLRWLVAAGALTIVAVANTAGSYRSALAAAGAPLDRRATWRASTVAHGLNLVVKSGGMAGLAVFVTAGRRQGRATAGVVAGYVLVALAGELSFAAILGAAIVVLVADHRLDPADAVATAVFVGYLVVRVVAVGVALRHPGRLEALAGRVRRLTTRVRRPAEPPHQTSSSSVDQAVRDLRSSLRLVARAPVGAASVMLHALATEAIGITTLYCVLRALGLQVGWTVPFVAYAISVLFGIVAFVPAGLGIVELSTGAALVSAHVPVAPATAAVVLFRLFELWSPAAIGALVHQVSSRAVRIDAPIPEPAGHRGR